MQEHTIHDVVITGGGLAGLSLARQLRARDPKLDIVVLDKESSPLPEAAHKVGESTVEVGSHYFGTYLGLHEYLRQAHLPKFGLRYFFGDAQGPFSARLEFGPQQFPQVPSLQLDRGRLENDLRRMVVEDGVDLREGAQVRKVDLGAAGEPHTAEYEQAGEVRSVRGRWLVDASGRRRLLQSRLGLSVESGHNVSSAWWRVRGLKKVGDMLGEVGRRPWDSRMQDKRWLSTNHIMGRGYWVWFIPLGSGHTSLGIVADEDIHPLRTYSSFERAIEWLRRHEPEVARYVEHDEPVDFKALRRFSYWSKQVFSADRWACVGEAGFFADPFYSPGSDYIALGNTMTCQLIERERAGALTARDVEAANHFMLEDAGQNTLAYYLDNYSVFGTPRVMVAKIHWDTCYYWGFLAQLFFQRHTATEHLERYSALAQRFLPINRAVQRLFRDWARLLPDASVEGGRFVPYSSMPLFRELLAELSVKKDPERMFADMERNLGRLEEWAQALFERAVADCMPDRLAELPRPLWVAPAAISLDPASWPTSGLQQPTSPPRSLDDMSFQNSVHVLRPLET